MLTNPKTKISLTPRVSSHQPPPPLPAPYKGMQLHVKSPLLPLQSKPSSSSTTPILLKKLTISSTSFTKPTSTSTLSTKSSTSFLRNITNCNTGNNNTRTPTESLGTISSELCLSHKPGEGTLVPISSNNNREMGIVQFERSRNKYDGRGIILPQDDANISIDKLLAQWADKINRAEQEFEQEELAFERAQVRLFATPSRPSLRSLSPNASTRLLEKAKRIINSQNHVDSSTRLSPIKRHDDHHHPL